MLNLDAEAPAFAEGDVVDNVSWYPDLTIRNCHVAMDSCRGFLVTTRGKVLIEKTTFVRTEMSAIDIADDANSWFESGSVKSVTIRDNHFEECGEPVIFIHPENAHEEPDHPVHEGIAIVGNCFNLSGDRAIYVKSVKGLKILRNRFSSKSLPIETHACIQVQIDENRLGTCNR
jgi:hypothetical protein